MTPKAIRIMEERIRRGEKFSKKDLKIHEEWKRQSERFESHRGKPFEFGLDDLCLVIFFLLWFSMFIPR